MMVTVEQLLYCTPELETQLCLLLINAIFWYLWINLSTSLVWEPWIAAQPWKERWIDLNRKTFKNSFFIIFDSKEEACVFACSFLAILIQHGVGGALCMPSTLGAVGRGAWALACHGALCEAGWELQDLATRITQILFGGEAGRAKNPAALMTIMCIHHAMGLCMVIPMNMYFNNNSHYHEFVFLLQFATFIALGLQNYGYTLDITTVSGLTRMKVVVSVTWMVMTWSRVVRYAMVGYELVLVLKAPGEHPPAMFYLGLCTVLGLMGLLNALFFLDASGKFKKFIGMHHKDEPDELHAAAAAVNGALHRQNSTHIPFFLTKSQKEWAKVRGAVKVMAALKHPSDQNRKAQ